MIYLYREAQIIVLYLTKFSSSGFSERISNQTRQIKQIKDEMNKFKVLLF